MLLDKNILHLAFGSLGVSEACSGLATFYSAIAIAVVDNVTTAGLGTGGGVNISGSLSATADNTGNATTQADSDAVGSDAAVGVSIALAFIDDSAKAAVAPGKPGYIASGEVDVVIGTHRLISDDIRFKDLGLLVIDEVQSGFARTGEHFWAFEAHDMVPDIVVIVISGRGGVEAAVEAMQQGAATYLRAVLQPIRVVFPERIYFEVGDATLDAGDLTIIGDVDEGFGQANGYKGAAKMIAALQDQGIDFALGAMAARCDGEGETVNDDLAGGGCCLVLEGRHAQPPSLLVAGSGVTRSTSSMVVSPATAFCRPSSRIVT